LALIDNGGTSVVAFIGNGAAISRVDGLLGVAGGVRARLAMRFDGAAGTDATRVTFRRSTYDAVTESWTAGAALTSSVVTPGVPAALISLAATTTPIAIGRYSYSTGGAFNGIIGGNGESVRVWSAALTDGEIDAELASDYVVRSSDLLLGYDFSGATPYANSGSAGAAGDLTPSANLVLASGDRRYSFVASPATNNPSYDDTGVYPVAVFNGTDNYFRNVDFGKLPQITADTMIAWIGTVPGLPVASYGMVSLSRAENLGLVMIRRNNAFVESTVDLASYAAVDAPEAGTMVALFSRRVSGGSGTAIAVRDGLGTEATATGSPVSGSNALNRLTICASRANVVSLFTPASVAQIIVMRGLTADNIDAAQRFIARMAAAHCGAVIR
jgi:hypothetical protein